MWREAYVRKESIPVPGVAQHEDSSELLAYVPTVSLPVSRVRIATRGLVLFLGVCCPSRKMFQLQENDIQGA